MEITQETVIIVTGASSGIGRALALALARRGARLGLLARRLELLEEVAREAAALGAEAVAIPCDVADRLAFQAAVDTVAERFGRVDVLVNNAGRGHFAYVDDTPEEQIESIFRVNVFSLWHGTAAALRHMKPRGSGLIVNVASMAGKLGYPANAAYVAAKHATVGFTRALRSELAGTGVEAIVVVPAGAMTDWANVTEGGPMLELFAYEGSRGAEIARERGIEPLPSFPLLTAVEVAEKIVAAIERPEPEVHTHPHTRDVALLYENDQLEAERRMEPFWLANREGYERRGS